MLIELLRTSSKFEKQYRKLTKKIQEAAKEKELLFRANPFDPHLGTHKLHGKDKDAWAFSVTDKHRIKFIFLTGNSALFLEIGTHAIYK